MAFNYGVNIMSENTIYETVGEKAQALYDAGQNKETCTVFVPYPIGHISGVKVSQINISVDSLDDVKIERSGITDTLTLQVVKDD